ncbi:MAG: hypothetical protein QM689_12735 [Oscillospiraceae bacterium]
MGNVREFVNVRNIHIAKVTKDTEAEYTAATPRYLAPAASVSQEVSVNSSPQYYDGVAKWTYDSEGVTTLTIAISGLGAEDEAELLGKPFDTESGRVFDTGECNPPKYAVSFEFEKGAGGSRFYQYLSGTFSKTKDEAETRTDSVTPKTAELAYAATPTIHKFQIGAEQKGCKRIYGDTDTEHFSATGWFTEVQTPPDVVETPEG